MFTEQEGTAAKWNNIVKEMIEIIGHIIRHERIIRERMRENNKEKKYTVACCIN